MNFKLPSKAAFRAGELIVALCLIAVLYVSVSDSMKADLELGDDYTVMVQPSAVKSIYSNMVDEGLFPNHSQADKSFVSDGPLGDIAIVQKLPSESLGIAVNDTVIFGPMFFRDSDIEVFRFARMIYGYSQAQQMKYDSLPSPQAAKKDQVDAARDVDPNPELQEPEKVEEKPRPDLSNKRKEAISQGMAPLSEEQKSKLKELLKERLKKAEGETGSSTSKASAPVSGSEGEAAQARPSGSVDVSKISESKTTVFYAGNEIPKIGYNSNEEMLSPDRRRAQVKLMLSKIAEKGDAWSVVYPAKGETTKTIAIFGDPTCPFCQSLHEAIPMLQDMGVKVHYLFYNRSMSSGSPIPDSATAGNRLMQNAWCAGDSASALSHAMEGYMTPGVDCSKLGERGKTAFPGNEHFLMGRILGMRGTPYTITDDGKVVIGLNRHARDPIRDYIERLGL